MPKKRHARIALLTTIAGVAILAAVSVLCRRFLVSLQAASSLYPSTSDRFGIGMSRSLGQVDDYDVARLRAGWYVDWGTQLDPSRPAGLDYMQIVRVSGNAFSPDEAALAAIIAANPGTTWIVGNEPDCIWQDNTTPDRYARVYHELYTFLKARDPTCRVTIGGIVQTTPLRLQWLDAVLDEYQTLYGEPLPVDLWNIHAFILREEKGSWGSEIPPGINATHGELWEIGDHDRMDLFAQQIVRFRQWMKDHGERDKELIVSEYGILMPDIYGFDTARVRTFMLNTFDYFLTATDPELGYPADGNRLVQRWAWYSLNDDLFEGFTSHSHLFVPDSRAITPLGLAFESYLTPLYTPYVDLAPTTITLSPSRPPALDGQPVTITLTAVVHNTGNTDAGNVPVQFWIGDPGQPVGSAQVVPTLSARSSASVSVEWVGVLAGTYVAGVTADAGDLIVEADESNNQLSSPMQMDLTPTEITSFPVQPLALDGQTVTITLSATVHNVGNTDMENVSVQFWVGDPDQPIGSAQIVPTLSVRSLAGASVEWVDVPAGLYTVGVTVDAANGIPESDEGNNQISRSLLVAEDVAFLPLVFKEQ